MKRRLAVYSFVWIIAVLLVAFLTLSSKSNFLRTFFENAMSLAGTNIILLIIFLFLLIPFVMALIFFKGRNKNNFGGKGYAIFSLITNFILIVILVLIFIFINSISSY